MNVILRTWSCCMVLALVAGYWLGVAVRSLPQHEELAKPYKFEPMKFCITGTTTSEGAPAVTIEFADHYDMTVPATIPLPLDGSPQYVGGFLTASPHNTFASCECSARQPVPKPPK